MDQAAAEQVVHRGNGDEPETLDPHRATGVPASHILRDLFEGLTTESRDGTLIPGAALRWNISRDARTYTFYLRRDLLWSNGEPLTALDFIYSLRRAVDPETASASAGALLPILNAREVLAGELPVDQLGVGLLDDEYTAREHADGEAVIGSSYNGRWFSAIVEQGQPISMLLPEVIGFELTGELKEGVTATDLVLRVTEMLRAHGVVGKFVEFYGDGLANLPLADRATIGNMSPEYGSTIAVFPIDEETLRYLNFTGRDEKRVALVEAYAKAQGMWRDADSPDPVFTNRYETTFRDCYLFEVATYRVDRLLGIGLVPVTIADMTRTRVCTDATLVYLVFNTITNLRTQQEQVACFRNASSSARMSTWFET